jgi:hypothetical protein
MSTTVNLTSYEFSPAEAMLVCDIREPKWFMKYLKDGEINYRTHDDGAVFFKEQDIINFLCGDWDESQTPESLAVLSEYADLSNDLERIQAQACQFTEQLNQKIEQARLDGELGND